MRSTGDATTVRLYHLDADSGGATTLFYGPLAAALAFADAQDATTQDGLYVQTDNDVIAYLDLIEE